MFKRLRIIFVIVAAAFAWACNNGGSTETHYIKLSDSALTFNGAGNASRTVTVASSPADWKAEPAVSWIKITETGKNSFVLTVDDSNVAEEREGIITVTAGQATVEVKVSQLPMDTEFARFRTMYEYENGMVMSPSGKYAGGFYATLDEDGSLFYHAVVTEVETDRKYEFGPYPMSLFEFGYPNAITDQGTIVFSTKSAGNYVINPALPWMVGAKLKSLPAEWDMNNYLDYGFFCEEHALDKKDKIVVITSNKAMTKGHRQRLDLVLGLKERIPELMDVYGAGFNKVDDKYDILSMYKYSLVMENCRYWNYWTEKLADAYLSLTFPFYSGCPNLDSYFDKNAFEVLNLEDVDKMAVKIEDAIRNDLFSSRKNHILSAKRDVLDKYNLFAMMSTYVSKNEIMSKKEVKTECTIQPLYRTFETRVRTRILKYWGWEI